MWKSRALSRTLWLHKKLKVIHRDIKPENILIKRNEHCAIGELGISITKECLEINKPKAFGPRFYLPKELKLINNCDYTEAKTNECTDLYAARVTFWETYTGKHKFLMYLYILH